MNCKVLIFLTNPPCCLYSQRSKVRTGPQMEGSIILLEEQTRRTWSALIDGQRDGGNKIKDSTSTGSREVVSHCLAQMWHEERKKGEPLCWHCCSTLRVKQLKLQQHTELYVRFFKRITPGLFWHNCLLKNGELTLLLKPF